MGDRKPAHQDFDAVVDITNSSEHGLHAYALVKYNFSFGNSELCRIQSAPLENDLREESDPHIPLYTDFWPFKEDIDVVIEGEAFSPNGNPSESFESAALIGLKKKTIKVFGPRVATIKDGNPQISLPEPIQSVSLGREEAYGGIDILTPTFAEPGSEAELALQFDHPGIYPRNQFGKGYMVVPDPTREIVMPSIENPADLLTTERIFVGSADRWFLQPLPWFLGYTFVADYPRLPYLGGDAWYWAPQDDRMPEVKMGWLPSDYRAVLGASFEDQGYHIKMRQEASFDMHFKQFEPGTPFVFYCMHEEKEKVGFKYPAFSPRLSFILDGQRNEAIPKLLKVVVYPSEERFTLLFSSIMPMEKKYIPGVHREIPLSIQVDDQVTIQYETPLTPREQLEQIQPA